MKNKTNLLIISAVILLIVIGGFFILKTQPVDIPQPPDVSTPPDTSTPNETQTSNNLILATFTPRTVTGRAADGEKIFGGFDFQKLPALLEAGINELGAPIEFMDKDGVRQQELRKEFVNTIKRYGIKYYHGVPTYKSPGNIIPAGEEPEDSNFTSGAMWLDEPYAYFPGRAQTEITVTKTSSYTPTDAANSYVRYIQRLLSAERRSPMSGGNGRSAPLPIVNTVESVAWYDLKAGADGFWVEGLGSFYAQQIHFFNEYFNLNIPETPDSYIRLIAAFERGAANHFNKPWGFGVYVGTPVKWRERILKELYDRGATYFFFWANHADGTLTTEEVIALAGNISNYAKRNAASKTQAKTAILIPAGYHIPGGIYCNQEIENRADCIEKKGGEYIGGNMWNLIPADSEMSEYGKTLRALGEAIKQALQSNDEFDILVNDESLRQDYLSRYERIVRVE